MYAPPESSWQSEDTTEMISIPEIRRHEEVNDIDFEPLHTGRRLRRRPTVKVRKE